MIALELSTQHLGGRFGYQGSSLILEFTSHAVELLLGVGTGLGLDALDRRAVDLLLRGGGDGSER